MNTLYLTGEEEKAFGAFSASLKEGWTVQAVTLVPERPEELTVRRGMASFDQPELREACERLSKAKEGDFSANVLGQVRPEVFTREQLAEIFFVLGVEALSRFIAFLFTQVKADQDVEAIASLAEIRNMLSEVNASQS